MNILSIFQNKFKKRNKDFKIIFKRNLEALEKAGNIELQFYKDEVK